MSLITLDKVTKIYPDEFVALEEISCRIREGEFVSLVGASGAGKSTLLKMIYANERPTYGAIYFGGRDIASIPERLLPFYRRNFGTVFQDFKLLPKKTVFENVAYALEVQGKSNAQIREEVPKILEIVGMADQMDKYPDQISGGEAQRIALARAVIHRPRVLIADEPTGNLDPVSTDEIIRLLLKINELGTTVILATHDQSIVDRLHKRVIVLNQGRIVRDDSQGRYN
ncbi:MAG: cell division ATP-binding protein FtsE [Candidatus Moranbacteria bacterium]|nr:cell division ATP-binding protein FtsE [Candidatus Moranbacteria bacterium]